MTDEYGNATVTWTLPDGSTATGESVTGGFDQGETVHVSVTDEYGATASASTVVGAVPPGQAIVAHLPLSLPLWSSLLLAASALVPAIVLVQLGLFGRGAAGLGGLTAALLRRLADDMPRITRLEIPLWNPAESRVEIPALEVIAPSGLLSAVELTITDADGTRVVSRTVEVGANDSYAASPEYVPVYGDMDLSDGQGYTLEVRAVDDRDRVGSVEQSTEWGVDGSRTA